MDTQLFGNSDVDIKNNVKEFCGFLYYEICILKRVLDAEEIAFAYTLFSELHDKICVFSKSELKLQLLYTINDFRYKISSVNKDLLRFKKYNRIDAEFLNVISSRTRFCSVSYSKYEKCVACISDYASNNDKIKNIDNCANVHTDMLVGSLRNREQLDLCLKYNFYHMPQKFLERNVSEIRYIALYQSKNLFGEYAGINYYGLVTSAESLKRSQIREIPKMSSDMYYKFSIEKWIRLPQCIKATGAGSFFSYTNINMLLSAKTTFELYFKTADEHKLYHSVMNALGQNLNKVYCKFNNSDLVILDGYLCIYNKGVLLYRVSRDEYLSKPHIYFGKIVKVAM